MHIFLRFSVWLGYNFFGIFFKTPVKNLKSARYILGSYQHFLQTLKGLSHEMDLAFKDMHGQLWA
jgi:hypothetical protein